MFNVTVVTDDGSFLYVLYKNPFLMWGYIEQLSLPSSVIDYLALLRCSD